MEFHVSTYDIHEATEWVNYDQCYYSEYQMN